jgi:hypothetical protein
VAGQQQQQQQQQQEQYNQATVSVQASCIVQRTGCLKPMNALLSNNTAVAAAADACLLQGTCWLQSKCILACMQFKPSSSHIHFTTF